MAETGKSQKAGGTKRGGSAPDRLGQLNLRYGDKFQAAMNDLFSSANIAATAAKIVQLEKTYGDFQVGTFNRYLLPDFDWSVGFPAGTSFDTFERDFQTIPADKRKAVSDTLRANFHAANPLPVFYQTSANVDPTSADAIVRPFVYNATNYLGVLYLCANPKQPK